MLNKSAKRHLSLRPVQGQGGVEEVVAALGLMVSNKTAPNRAVAANAAVGAEGVRDRRRKRVGIHVPAPRAQRCQGTRARARANQRTAAQRQFVQRIVDRRGKGRRSTREYALRTEVHGLIIRLPVLKSYLRSAR